jgi:hypothetical protein
MPVDMPCKRGSRTDLAVLLAAVLALGCCGILLAACGGNDLIFPGDIPATATAQFTATPTP